MNRKKPTNCVEVKVVTWDKDSHGLFDYECKSYKHKYYHLINSCVLFQNQTNSELESASQASLNNLTDLQHYSLLGKIHINHSLQQFIFERFKLNNQPHQQNKLQPHLVVRSLKDDKGEQRGYPLQLGDIIKFGRLQYNVVEFRDPVHFQSNGKLTTTFKSLTADKHEQGVCRICFLQQQTEDNFLLAPCDCKGSNLLVHRECLQNWIQYKTYKQSHGVVQEYNFSKLECEVCLRPFPYKIIRQTRQYEMIIVEKPKQPYIILESLSQKYSNLFLITFKNKNPTVRMGRGHECQMRLTDISVSRVHAYINYRNGKFTIFDNNSKFGTLIQISRHFKLSVDRCAIQVGRTVLICVVKTLSNLKQKRETEEVNQVPEIIR